MANTPYYTKAETDALLIYAGTSFRASVVPSSPAPTLTGIYIPTQSGTYTNFGGIVVDLSDGYTTLTYDGTNFGSQVVPLDIISQLVQSEVLVQTSKNMINPINIAFDRRYSTGGNQIVSVPPMSTEYIASSGLIEVQEGEFYTVSGAGIFVDTGLSYQGGYFGSSATGAIGNPSINDITFAAPVAGSGKIFQVPIGQNIKYVVINLATNTMHNALTGDVQMELGEIATAYTPFELINKINPELLPDNPEAETSELDKYLTFGNLSYNLNGKLPNFRAHYVAKDKDLVVLNTGTSLTARSIEHCTAHSDASFRPPLMHSMNFATHIWDALNWEEQQYRRYDSAYFTETGTFTTASNVANWDDGIYRSGLTRYADGGSASVQCQIPIGAWQFNFIQRLDNLGTTSATVAITEGNGLVQVYNEGTSTWVEANGFVFSQLNPTPVIIPSVTYINPSTGANTVTNNYTVGGNTTYQKRLKFRCRNGSGLNSTATAKTLTISKTTGRLMYWGVEWSPREFMISYINAARGSHSSIIVDNLSLLHYQDNEVWSFRPDLILSEDPIHNSGASGVMAPPRPSAYWGRISENFFFANNDVSLQSRAADLGITGIEWAIFNSTIEINGIDSTGNLITYINSDGRAITALDAQMMAMEYMKSLHSDIVGIQSIKHWIDAGYACYGNLRTSTLGSGKPGLTFTSDGQHWNDTGSRIMARIVLPILDLYY